MRRLAILIDAPSPREVQEALDDVVAAIVTGQTEADYEDGRVRIKFDWQEQPEQS